MTTTTEAVKGGDMVAPMVSSPTPWGYADEVDEVAEGIWFVSTMTHGGFYLDAQRNALVPAEIKAETYWQRGEAGWYEEDCDWAIVCLIFRPEFIAYTQRLGKNRDRSNTEAQLAQAEATFEWWRKKHGFGPSIRQAMLVPRLVEALRTAHATLYTAKASGDDGVDDQLAEIGAAIDLADRAAAKARMRDAAPDLLVALIETLAFARALEKHSGEGVSGRRGGAVFAKASAAIDRATKATSGE